MSFSLVLCTFYFSLFAFDFDFLQHHWIAATIADAVLVAFDGADVAPVIDVVQLAVLEAMDVDDLQAVGLGIEASRKAHGAVEQALVLGEHASAGVVDEGIDLAAIGD